MEFLLGPRIGSVSSAFSWPLGIAAALGAQGDPVGISHVRHAWNWPKSRQGKTPIVPFCRITRLAPHLSAFFTYRECLPSGHAFALSPGTGASRRASSESIL